MLKVGLTGGIASGKSVVGKMFVALGAYLVQADHIAHELMMPGQPVYDEVIRHFGRDILDPDGNVNRARLAKLAFGSRKPGTKSEPVSRVEELNRIVHPAVIRRQEEWIEDIGRKDPQAIAIVEAALILEAGAGERFDKLIVVTCTEEQRAARFAARQKISLADARQQVRRRMSAQLSDAEKIKAADYVIDNSGSLAQTQEQVGRIWPNLRVENDAKV
jgi:dephospho-CoA kinase